MRPFCLEAVIRPTICVRDSEGEKGWRDQRGRRVTNDQFGNRKCARAEKGDLDMSPSMRGRSDGVTIWIILQDRTFSAEQTQQGGCNTNSPLLLCRAGTLLRPSI